jgi:hypothetical protein
MKTGTGVLGFLFAVVALIVTATNTRTAQARLSLTHLPKAPTTSVVTKTNEVVANVASKPNEVVTTRAAAVVPAAERITAPAMLENPKLRRMQKAEISAAMLQVAAQIVRKHYAKPVGTQVEVEVDGKHLYARIERHFHPEGGPVKPWGFHPGVSLFCAR